MQTQNPARMRRSDITAEGCAPHSRPHWLLPFAHMILIGGYKGEIAACCVSNSHHPTQREAVHGSDDSLFVAVWDSPICGA